MAQRKCFVGRHKCCKRQRISNAFRRRKSRKRSLGKMSIRITLMMVCTSGIQSVDTAVPQYQTDGLIFKYHVLMTPQCNDVELMKRSRCSADDYTGSVYFEMCGFSQLCSQGTTPLCVNTEIGMTHICLPENTICPKGYKRQFWVDDSDIAHVRAKNVKCPPGTYQPTISSCTNACQYTHRDLATLGNQYVVHSNGDHVSPIYVYCNYRQGFYSPEGKFLIDIDADDSNACIHTAIYNPCVRDQRPLPNGTCVNPCANGSCRDDHDGFHCKMKNLHIDCEDSKGGLETLAVLPKVNNNIDSIYRPPSETTTGLMAEEDENQHMKSLGEYKIAITVLIAVTIMLCVLALVALFLLKDEEDEKMMPVDKWI